MGSELKGRRILLTGASSGIGRALAGLLAREGGRLVLTGRSQDRLESLAGELARVGAEVLPVTADLTADADRERLVETTLNRFGGALDVLINNAGVGSFGHFAGGSEAILRQVMEVNFFAPAELTRRALAGLKRGTEPVVVNVSSMCGRRGVPAWPEYSASKFALSGLTESLRGELAPFAVDVLLIVPGLTRSELRGHLLRNDGRYKIGDDAGMTAETVAAGILAALHKRRRETVLGSDARWVLRVQRWFPRLVDFFMARKVRQLYAT
jgi:short-subunit dehydrogenase